MFKFKVTPFHRNGYSAPYRVVEVPKTSKNPYGDAVGLAKQNNRLADFDCWHFEPEIL
mgnify:CR=1 FL=1